ncbi:acyl-CoA thioesterase [Nonomuraea sp. SYSU D8015]|uniref:acyl-CoA thioesterase n=1 Tax=Nonomuraea sp. SYSU D8015 TaxID=2593644 RepID=UPI001660FAF0|nr:acyl-CoA thioesterase [Nonomuraea sp. SYSU D8015]
MPEVFEHRHVVTLEETNQLGNVYFAHFLRWQGQARELFLRRMAPEVLAGLDEEHALVTTHVSCTYLAELVAFDEIAVRMRVGRVMQNRMSLRFEYWRLRGGEEELVARGEQEVAWLRREAAELVPVPVPPTLLHAIDAYLSEPVRTAWRS